MEKPEDSDILNSSDLKNAISSSSSPLNLKKSLINTSSNIETMKKSKNKPTENQGSLLDQLNKLEADRTHHFISSIMVDNHKNTKPSNEF